MKHSCTHRNTFVERDLSEHHERLGFELSPPRKDVEVERCVKGSIHPNDPENMLSDPQWFSHAQSFGFISQLMQIYNASEFNLFFDANNIENFEFIKFKLFPILTPSTVLIGTVSVVESS